MSFSEQPKERDFAADLPSLPTGWSWDRFAHVCERVSVGHVGPTSEFFCDRQAGVPFVRSQDVRPGRLMLENTAAILPSFHGRLRKSRLRPGDVLIVRVGANRGDCCVVPDNVGELNCANIVFARPKRPTGFHAYFFQSPLGRQLLLSATTGAAQGVINTGSVAAMPVPVPPQSVQHRVASILSAYDQLVENCERRIRVLDEMTRALYREWFVLFRYPGHQKTPLIDSALGRIPKGWRADRAGAIACENRRGVPKGALKDGPTRYVGLEHIPRRLIALDAWEETAELGSNKLRFEPGEVLFGKIRPYFHKVSLTSFDGICSADTFVISATHPNLRAFTVCLVSSDAFVAHASATANGAKMPRCNWDVMMAFPVAVPPRPVLESFSAVVEPWFDDLRLLVLQAQNLRKTRDLVLPRLLSGQLSVDEVA